MPMVRCESAAGRFPTPRVPGANMGDLYHIDADGLQAYPRCESWNCCRFSLHCHLTAGDTLFDIMKASFRSSLLSVYCNSVTELPWMLWNDLFQGFVYRGIFFKTTFNFRHCHCCKVPPSISYPVDRRYFNQAATSTIFSKNFLTNFFFRLLFGLSRCLPIRGTIFRKP